MTTKAVLLVAISTLTLVSTAHADQAATIKCTGGKIILETKTPYLGENSPAAQELFVLKSLDNENETKSTAYFLDVEQDVGGKRNCFGAGSLVFSGTNSVKGSFELCIHVWEDAGNGTTIRQTSKGVISYNHGPLKGKGEPVSCVRE